VKKHDGLAVAPQFVRHLDVTEVEMLHRSHPSSSPAARCHDQRVDQFEQILVEPVDAVLRITLNRPERMNAWTPTMMAELTTAVKAANDDRAIGAIVVTGAGRGFCAGADIEAVFESQLHSDEEGPSERPERPDDWVRLCRESKPLIAAINGPAIGVGLTLVLPFDQILAAEGAKLSARFVKMGLVPELASSHWLVTRCGFGAASWLALSGATVVAEEARELGLVDRVTTPGALVDEAMDLAGELAANPPTQLRLIKQLLTANAAETDLAAVQRRELEAMKQCYRSPEHAEAVRAFLEKRQPVFR
jgi:enoyl-CoA hydratase/carnithine racemase